MQSHSMLAWTIRADARLWLREFCWWEEPMPETVVHFQLRMPPQLHEKLASRAKGGRVSLNALIVGILDRTTHESEQHAVEAAPVGQSAAAPPIDATRAISITGA